MPLFTNFSSRHEAPTTAKYAPIATSELTVIAIRSTDWNNVSFEICFRRLSMSRPTQVPPAATGGIWKTANQFVSVVRFASSLIPDGQPAWLFGDYHPSGHVKRNGTGDCSH